MKIPRRMMMTGMAVIGAWLLIAGCGKQRERTSADVSTEALRIFIWEDSIPADVLKDFEKETGIPVKADYYAQLEVLIERVRQDPSRYDIVAPSDYAVKAMADKHLLMPLPSACDGWKGKIGDRFRTPWYDPGLTFCLPFQWSLSGLAYNRKHVKRPPASWAEFLDAERSMEWAGRISLLDDPREVMGVSLLANGHGGPTATDPAALESAASRLRAFMPQAARLDSERFEDGLISGALWLAHGYNGDLARAKLHNPDIEYVIPAEGAILSVDNLAIPAGSKHAAQALRFIEYILRPESARRITEAQGLASTLARQPPCAKGGLDPAIIYGLPPAAKTFSLGEKGPEAARMEKLWKDIRNF